MKFYEKMYEIFGINVNNDDIKSEKKTKLYTLFRQYNFWNLGLRRWFFFEWNFFFWMKNYTDLAIFHSI